MSKEIKEDVNGNLNYAKKESGNTGAVIAMTVAVSRSIRHKEGKYKPQPPKAAFPTYNPEPKNDIGGIGQLGVKVDTSHFLDIMYSKENIDKMIDVIRESFHKELERGHRAKGFK